MIDKANMNDLKALDELALEVITHMKESKIPQWEYNYPRYEHFKQDVIDDCLIIYKDQGLIVGCMALLPENDPPYKTITSWKKNYSTVIHRVLVKPSMSKLGIAKQMLDYAINDSIENGYESIKIDTHVDNFKMRKFLVKNGFIEGDYIESIDRIAYELILEDLK